MNVSKQPKTIFRTPPDLKMWLFARAKSNGRSMTSELVQILRATKQEDDACQTPSAKVKTNGA